MFIVSTKRTFANQSLRMNICVVICVTCVLLATVPALGHNQYSVEYRRGEKYIISLFKYPINLNKRCLSYQEVTVAKEEGQHQLQQPLDDQEQELVAEVGKI